MIKINKDYIDIPRSLDDKCHARPAITTNCRRRELISAGKYIDNNKYNSRYKRNDIKEKLTDLYHHKCAFCETRVEQLHVEHYRPKTYYYWLAYSWDNLLLACPTCNECKVQKFDVKTKKAVYSLTVDKKINKLGRIYDRIEHPLLVNPEAIDPELYLTYDETGAMYSTEPCFIWTIDACNLNRTYLKDERRKILNEIKHKVNQRKFVYKNNKKELKTAIKNIVEDFKLETGDQYAYAGFRRYALRNLLKKLLAS